MGSKPYYAKVIAVVGSVFLILSSAVTISAEINWTTLTSLKDVRRMRTFHDSVYIATGGGLLIVTDPKAPGKIFDNLSDLQATDLTDVIEASDGQKWVAAQGRLIKFGIAQSRAYPFFDTEGNSIRLLCLADDGDNLWVGTSIGLVLFSKINDGGQIQDSYVMFGSLDPSPAVNDILLVGDSIWLATSAGVAVANRSVPNLLKVPSSWTTYGANVYPELGSAQPRRVVLFESKYYIGTSDGLFRLDRAPIDTLAKLAFGIPPWVTELKIENDSLFIYLPDGLGVLKSGAITLLGTFGLPIFPVNGTNTGSYRWLALLIETGLYENSTGTFSYYSHTGLPATAVTDVVLGGDGMVTGLFKKKRVYQQTDSGWTSLPFGGEPLVGVLDSSGTPWIGTIGNGLWRVFSNATMNYDETNSPLRGNNDPNGTTYVFVRGLAINSQYIFATAYRAINGYPVAFGDLSNLDSPSGWDSLGISDGLTDAEAWSIDIFGSLVAVGTRANGVFVIDLGTTPRVKSDDTSIHYTTSVGPLLSNDVNCVKFSPEGDLWVGTSFGVSRLLNGYPRFATVNMPSGFGPEVNAIEFDPRGNVWLGAANGQARFDATVGEFEIFTTRNSGLVHNNVNSIRYEARTGDVFIATDGGLSIARSQFGKPTADVASVLSFPNPFVVDSPDDILRFNFSRPGTVRILTVAGERVTEIKVGDGWSGVNDSGKPVASGVYFFVITSDVDGSIGTGKFLLVRNR